MPLLVMKLVMMKIPKSPMPFFVKPIAKGVSDKVQDKFISPRLKDQLDFIETTLSDRTWFTGENLSAADIQMSFPLMAASTRTDLSAYPNIAAFVERVKGEASFQAAIKKSGAFTTL